MDYILTILKKVPSNLNSFNNTDYDTRIRDVEVKIPSITNLATTAALTAVESKIPNISDLVERNHMMQKQKTPRINISHI